MATKFRQWATQHIKEYIVKGFEMDDERLKNPHQPFDYFEELILRIQDIRTSERRFYQKITDIYATSVDYDPTLETSILFFQTVQNKMHWAITGKTADEIIIERANSKENNSFNIVNLPHEEDNTNGDDDAELQEVSTTENKSKEKSKKKKDGESQASLF